MRQRIGSVFSLVGSLALAGSLLAGGCDATTGDSDEDLGAGPGACSLEESLAAQGAARFPLGETYWLPRAAADCEGAQWAVVSSPDGAVAAVVEGSDGWARFTPDAVGGYVVQLGATEHEVSITVVDRSAWPFHNYNYYPSSSQAVVGDELWVANPYASTVARLDASSLASQGSEPVGSWPVAIAHREGGAEVLVAHRGSDTVGFLDAATGELVDAVWVGDEPSNLVMNAAGTTAYVSLATEGAIAVVDVASRAVSERLTTLVEPFAMALSADESELFVATQRSGQVGQYPLPDLDPAEERDIAALDLATGEVTRWFKDVGTTINSLTTSADGQWLYVASSWTDNTANFTDVEEVNFEHRVAAIDLESGAVSKTADLGRQDSSGGWAVTLHGLAWSGDALWVAAEGSDLAIALDPGTLEEIQRVEVGGRPRSVVAGSDGSVYVHGSQAFEVTHVTAAGAIASVGTTGADPRPADVAEGQRYFTGAGRDYAQNWGCDSCHAEARTDQVIWRAGPFESARETSRPLFWLEGTWPLGWAGYVASPRNFAFATNTNVGVRPTTDEAETLAAYLESIMPPPAANGWTRRDGSLSEAGARGKAIYEGKGACSGCHALPLTTNRVAFEVGVTEGKADVPALVGAYRHNVWLKHGEAHTLREAVVAVLEWLGNSSLTEAEIDDLTRYVSELTGRDFFALTTWPRPGSAAAPVDQPLTVVMSFAVHDEASNLAGFWLEDSAGTPVNASVAADGRYVTVTPTADLAHGETYTLVVDAGVESLDTRLTEARHDSSFTTAEAPTLALDGEYVWTVQLPAPDFEADAFNPDVTLPVTATWNAVDTGTGTELVVDYGSDLVYEAAASISGSTLHVEQILIAVATSFADTGGIEVELTDDDGDGVADSASGTLLMLGPGFEVPDVAFTLGRPEAPGEGCEVGSDGPFVLEVTIGADGVPTASWDFANEGNALGFYVTDPGVTLPFAPGSAVEGGETYWALATEEFPAGFEGPVVYGTVQPGSKDDSEVHGAAVGGEVLEAGGCYQFSVITNAFTTATTVVKL